MDASRRTLLRSTAWAVPAVSIAAAAPAFAGSPARSTLHFAEFDVTPVRGTGGINYFHNLDLGRITIAAIGAAPAQEVTLSFTFGADGGPNQFTEIADTVIRWGTPSGWTTVGSSPTGTVLEVIQYRSVSAVASGRPVFLGPASAVLGTGQHSVSGVFTVVASAPGFASATRTVRVGGPAPSGKVVGVPDVEASVVEASSRAGRQGRAR